MKGNYCMSARLPLTCFSVMPIHSLFPPAQDRVSGRGSGPLRAESETGQEICMEIWCSFWKFYGKTELLISGKKNSCLLVLPASFDLQRLRAAAGHRRVRPTNGFPFYLFYLFYFILLFTCCPFPPEPPARSRCKPRP